jgi:hypothetical protein
MMLDRRFPRLVSLAGCLLLTGFALFAFLRAKEWRLPTGTPFADLVYGETERPFVTRLLVPGTTRLLTAATPEPVRENLGEFLSENAAARYVLESLNWTPDIDVRRYGAETLWALLLLFSCAMLFFCSVRVMHHVLYLSPRTSAISVTAAFAFLAPFLNYVHLYDLATLGITTAALAAMAAQRQRTYLVLFVLAVINKETAILLTLVHVLTARPTRAVLLFQVSIWFLVRSAIGLAFRDNPGSAIEFHLLDHNLQLLRYWSLSTVLAWIAVVVLVLADWGQKPRFLRRALIMAWLLIGFTLFFGFLDELRDYYEVYPVVLFLLLQPLHRLAGHPMEPRPDHMKLAE